MHTVAAPYVICSCCCRRLIGYRGTGRGYHVLPHKTPAGVPCEGRQLTDHRLEQADR